MDWETTLSKSRQTTLPDGRSLGYADHGEPEGFPVLYFHGFPGSRLEASLAADAAARQGIRLIAIDRPGYGLSTPKPDRKLLDWPGDVAALANSLGLAQFSVMGVSGGGPFALACALRLQERLYRVGLVAGLGPLREGRINLISHLKLLSARAVFPLIYRVLESQAKHHPERTVALAARLLSESDRKVLNNPEVSATLQRSLQEAFRQGSAGMQRDMELYGEPWGFSLEEVNFPIELWHGEDDRLLAPKMGRRQADVLPDARPHFIPGEGHFSLPIKYAEEMLGQLSR